MPNIATLACANYGFKVGYDLRLAKLIRLDSIWIDLHESYI